MVKAVTDRTVFSMSVSFVRTLPERLVSSATVLVSAVPTGVSLTAVIVRASVDVEVSVPSVAV